MYHFANLSRACTAWTNQITRGLLVQRHSSKRLQAVLKHNEESSKFGTGDYTYVFNSELVLKKTPKLGSRKEIGETQGSKAYLSKWRFLSNA